MNHSFKRVEFPHAEPIVSENGQGVVYLEAGIAPPEYEPNILKILDRQAARHPDRHFLHEKRPSGEWEGISYADFATRVQVIGNWLLDQNVPPGQSVLILSGNSIHHAALTLAGLYAGVPVCPVSPNYALMRNYERLDHVCGLVTPAIVYAEHGEVFKDALLHLRQHDVTFLTMRPESLPFATESLQGILARSPRDKGAKRSLAEVSPDGIFKLMLTSGSTGAPKAVIHTSRMLAANAAYCLTVMEEAASWKDTTLDWLPWNHASGALVLILVLLSGGTLYIDDGKPMQGQFEKSLANIKELQIDFLTNIPLAYEMLVDALEKDPDFRRIFFRNIKHLVYGGAGISRSLYDRFQELAIAETGQKILFGSGYGATETTSGVLSTYFEIEGPGVGLPLPGVKTKLVPVRSGYELRLAGDVITRGYYRRPDLNEDFLDEEGYYTIGDVVDWVDATDPAKGLRFVGRLTDEFKLGSGTWVNSFLVRDRLLKYLGPYVRELVVCGLNEDQIGLLLWPAPEHAASDDLTSAVTSGIVAYNEAFPGSSTRVGRFMFLETPPDPRLNEISDKGTISAQAVRQNRRNEISTLFATPPCSTVLVI